MLFLDRSHARARAYIERARSALAERQRESEELLQNGVAAFERGDGGEARRLVQAAIEGGAPTDEALAVLDRLDRLNLTGRRTAVAVQSCANRGDARRGRVARGLVGAVHRAACSFSRWPLRARIRRLSGGRSTGARCSAWQTPAGPRRGSTIAREPGLALPRRGELALTRARALVATGHLRDALTALDLVRPTDPQKAEADRLRGEIQLQLIALTSVPGAASRRRTADRPVP